VVGSTNRVRQVIFQLREPGKDVAVTGYEMGNQLKEPVPGRWRITPSPDGYTLDAAVPRSFFGITLQADAFLVDAVVIAAPYSVA
jgi:hypothetical protein